MEQRLLAYWEGSDAPSNGRIVEAESRWGLDVATDYDLACDVKDWAGSIRVQDGNALVISTDGGAAGTWISGIEGAPGALVEWGYADSDEDIIEAARELISTGELAIINEFDVATDASVLFVAAERGFDDRYKRLSINLPAGKYMVMSGQRSTETISTVCHVFKLQK